MKIQDIDRLLPNGFHDAILNKIVTNYITRELVFELEVLQPNDKGKLEYREGYLLLSNLFFIVIEPPDPTYDYVDSELFISSGTIDRVEKDQAERLPLKGLPEDAFVYWFFISGWNSFVYFSAVNANFRWGTLDKPGEIL